jgi:tRNA(fMet)-specific endonuclease VapC
VDNSRILIDTSIIIEYLRKKKKEETVLYCLCQSYDDIFVSTITEFEIFSGINPKNEQAINQLFEGFTVLSFDSNVAQRASQEYQQLKSQNKLIEIRDIFIGATAIVHNLPLATLNIKHLKRIKDLEIV